MRIGFSGAPGSGKTSTARLLSARLRQQHKNLELVNEYARRYISKYGKIESISEQFRIYKKQLDLEDSVNNAEIIITDCPVFIGFFYSLELRDLNSQKDILWMNDLFKEMTKINIPQRYDIIFHVPPKIKPVKDGIRAEHQFEDEWRDKADQKIKFIFELFPPKKFYQIEETNIDKRVEFCIEKISEYVKME